MRLKIFFNLVEIKTKVASIIPFLLGTLYAIYHFQKINVKNLIIFFISMITFDMVTTAINNFFDFKKANKRSSYNYEKHNAIVSYNLNPNSVLFIIFTLLIIAIIAGIILFFNTDIIVLITGILCFSTGVFYSFGPVPISRTPSGEIFSGFIMGFFIIFLSVYIHIFDLGLINFSFNNATLNLNINYVEILYIIILSIPCICGIANIMLANNICDMETDLEDKRYTLPVYIGKKKSLYIFAGLYGIAFVDLIILALLQTVSIFALLSLITLIPVIKNIIFFFKNQSKKDTFSLSVNNFLLINGTLIIIQAIVISYNVLFNGMKINLILK